MKIVPFWIQFYMNVCDINVGLEYEGVCCEKHHLGHSIV